MTLKIIKRDALRNCGKKEQIEAYLAKLEDPTVSYSEFTDVCSWLRGTSTVLRKYNSTKSAADYILATLRGAAHRESR